MDFSFRGRRISCGIIKTSKNKVKQGSKCHEHLHLKTQAEQHAVGRRMQNKGEGKASIQKRRHISNYSVAAAECFP